MAKPILSIRLMRCLGNRYREAVGDDDFLSFLFRCLHMIGIAWLRQHLKWVNKKKENCRDSIATSFAR